MFIVLFRSSTPKISFDRTENAKYADCPGAIKYSFFWKFFLNGVSNYQLLFNGYTP